jgi:hypothetical protein
MTWADVRPEDLAGFWRRLGGGAGSAYQDAEAFRRLAAEASAPRVVLAMLSRDDLREITPWQFFLEFDDSIVPADYVAVAVELALELDARGLLPANVPMPPLSEYLVYLDLREGLVVPDAMLEAAYERAASMLEGWVRDYFEILAIPTGNVDAGGGTPRRRGRASARKGFRLME